MIAIEVLAINTTGVQIGIPERREDMEYVPQPDEACPCKVSLHCSHYTL